MYLEKILNCINLQLPIVNLIKVFLRDMHHRKTYVYINLQQNRVCRSVITVHTNIFAKNRKMHKFATTKCNFEKNQLFQTCVIV